MSFADLLFIQDTGSTAYQVAAGIIDNDLFPYDPNTNIYTPVGGNTKGRVADRADNIVIPQFPLHPISCTISYLSPYAAGSLGTTRFNIRGGAPFTPISTASQEQYNGYIITMPAKTWYDIVLRILDFRLGIVDFTSTFNNPNVRRVLGETPSDRTRNQLEFFADQIQIIDFLGHAGSKIIGDPTIVNAVKYKIVTSTPIVEGDVLELYYDPVSFVYNYKFEIVELLVIARDYYA